MNEKSRPKAAISQVPTTRTDGTTPGPIIGADTWVARCAAFEREFGFELGVEAVYQAGQAVLPGGRKIWRHPRYEELERRRTEPVESECGLKSCAGQCSRCIRFYAVTKNQRLYGHPDFPGVAALKAVA